MRCPYCRYPLEPLMIGGRSAGVWQCLHCKGAWLKAAHHGGVAGLLPGPAGSPLPAPYASGPADTRAGAYAGGFGAGQPLHNPWQSTAHTSGRPDTSPPKSGGDSWWKWFGGSGGPQAPKAPLNPDWDICTWCGKTAPGMGTHCQHCKIERMRCPECQAVLVGARRHAVMVDLCLRCQGIWFEKGRLEALMGALRGEPARAVEGPSPTGAPSLLMQLASFLESTERSAHAEPGREEVGLWDALSATFASGVGGSKQVLYDLLTLVGDLQGSQRGNKGGPRG